MLQYVIRKYANCVMLMFIKYFTCSDQPDDDTNYNTYRESFFEAMNNIED